MRKSRSFIFLLFLVAFNLSGCAAKKDLRVLWPPPPNEPKLEWINVLRSAGDLPKSGSAKLIETLAGESLGASLHNPFGVACGVDGTIYVSEPSKGTIVVFDHGEKKVFKFSGGGALREPTGMSVDQDGNLYVVDKASKNILIFSSDRKAKGIIKGADYLKKPIYVAVDENLGRVYVSDTEKHQIVVFNLRDGAYLFSFGQHPKESAHFNLYSPQGIAIDKQGRIFVADMLNARIQVFDPNGKPLKEFGQLGNKDWNFEFPKDLAFDSAGNLHIIDIRKAAMLSYTPNGEWLLFLGSGKTSNPLGFALPTSMCIDANDQIMIVDRMNQRVAVWQYLSQSYLDKNPVTEEDLELILERINELEEQG